MGMQNPKTVLERILAQTEPHGECLIWTGRTDVDGYGRLHLSVTATDLVHRAAWIERHGPIPSGLVVMHICDNPPCVAVHHLVLGTTSANLADMTFKGRRGSNGSPTCHLGHAREIGKQCKKCDVIRHRRARERKLTA